MGSNEEMNLSSGEIILLAKRVRHWIKTFEDETEWKSKYTGCYSGLHFVLLDEYDPGPYEGHGDHISLSVSLDDITLGSCRYDFQKTEGTVDYERGLKELETFVDDVKKLPSKARLTRDEALRYAKGLMSAPSPTQNSLAQT